ncbi:YIP1 family protein [Bowmanella dokdonensis]|uniref:YIP1 family protein n=1 Tax=Bowmanella dokdonensis TaxID=751969 RepID=A0A939DRM8_9ALTE|nr:YIP1 family protein [Bowmanella dokdonensis]MBN7827557.1 YIP1 family protein [Bowmanella dokdonensis]
MQEVNNPFAACRDVLFRPNPVFAKLARVNNWSWVPFLLLVCFSAMPAYLYFNSVDMDWYQNLIINQQFADVSPAEQDAARRSMTASNLVSLTILMSSIGLVVINAILAVYLNLMTKVDEHNVQGFTDWYGMTWWVSLPNALGAVLSILVILIAQDGQLSPESLNVTSVAFWLSVPMSSEWFTLTQSIRLESFWTIYLIAVGISQWTQIPSNKVWTIAIAPYAVIWTAWILILLF